MLFLAFILTCVRIALATCPGGGLCIRKCCPLEQSFGLGQTGLVCEKANATGRLVADAPDTIPVRYSKPDCPIDGLFQLQPDEEHEINYNGTVLYEGGLEEYCVERNTVDGSIITMVCIKEEDIEYESETINKHNDEKAAANLYSKGVIFSVPFLFVTVIVNLLMPNHKVYRKYVLNYTISMLITYSCLAVAQTGLIDSTQVTPCTSIGFAIQFFFLGTFFWLNVMCFDIYWAFSGIRKPTGSVKERDRKKLILYSIYAWGIPLLILIITIAIDYSPGVPDTSIFKPKVGVEKCFFREYYATLIYFYMPMGAIILSNIFLFSVTAYRISTLRKETAVLKKDGSRKHDQSSNDKERFSLYFKLFLVMGINWVMELISALVGGPDIIWYVPDITNTLQGVFIFIIFVLKRRVIRLIKAKLAAMCGKKLTPGGSKGQWSGSTRNTGSVTTTSGGYSQNSVKTAPSNNFAMTPQSP